MNNFIDSWNYLYNLDAVKANGVNYFNRCLKIIPIQINPETNEVDVTDSSKNTKTVIWLEFGRAIYNAYAGRAIIFHDINLDCGADTFEQAIIKLAELCRENNYE